MKNINYENYLYIEGDESGYIKSYANLWDVYRGLKDIKQFDKRQKIKDIYHIIWVCKGIEREIKITKRLNNISYKVIN